MPRREKHGSKKREKVSQAIYPFGVSGEFERKWKSSKAFQIMLRVPAEDSTLQTSATIITLYIYIYTTQNTTYTANIAVSTRRFLHNSSSVDPASRTQSDIPWRIETPRSISQLATARAPFPFLSFRDQSPFVDLLQQYKHAPTSLNTN